MRRLAGETVVDAKVTTANARQFNNGFVRLPASILPFGISDERTDASRRSLFQFSVTHIPQHERLPNESFVRAWSPAKWTSPKKKS